MKAPIKSLFCYLIVISFLILNLIILPIIHGIKLWKNGPISGFEIRYLRPNLARMSSGICGLYWPPSPSGLVISCLRPNLSSGKYSLDGILFPCSTFVISSLRPNLDGVSSGLRRSPDYSLSSSSFSYSLLTNYFRPCLLGSLEKAVYCVLFCGVWPDSPAAPLPR